MKQCLRSDKRNGSRFNSAAHLCFSLFWHISGMEQNSHTSFCHVSGNSFTARLLWSIYFGLRGLNPRDNHTSVKPLVKASTSRQHRPTTHLASSITYCTVCPPWDLEVEDMTDYPFKTIDMGGVEQSHHQELIGPSVPFLVTTVTHRPRRRLQRQGSLSAWLCQWVVTMRRRVAVQVLLITTMRRGCFLNTGIATEGHLPHAL